MNRTIVEGLAHSFISKRNSIKVIDQFSCTVNEGEILAILGPSGCGKSTILRCIAGFIKPGDGKITINAKTPEFALQHKMIGFAFQDAALLEWKTVRQNIMLPAIIGRISEHGDVNSKLENLIKLMRLDGFEHFYPSQLSGGMKQRVALARAFLLEPSLLLLDEPFGSLDLLTRSKLVVEFSKILNSNFTPTVIVTHSIEEAVFLADRVVILSPRPAKILSIIKTNRNRERSFLTFEDPEFLIKVSECRKILINHWNEIEA